MEMVCGWILRIGLRQQFSNFNTLVEFAGNVSEIGRRDFESFAFAHTVAQLIGLLQILVAERQIAQIAV